MAEKETEQQKELSWREILRLTWVPVLVASLCCLAPVIVVLFGLGSVSFAISLYSVTYGTYWWAFVLAGVVLVGTSLVLYFRRRKSICTIDEAKKRRQEILNISLIVFFAAAVAYIVWNYGIVAFIGSRLGIW